MIFNSIEFIFFFLPVVIILFRLLIGKKYSYGITLLIIASLIYYAWWNLKYILLIIFSVCINYFWSKLIKQFHNKGSIKRTILIVGITLNLIVIAYFKYTNFILINLNELFKVGIAQKSIVLPLAISFFTFQQITYLVDTYKGEVSKHGFLYYCLYVTFFPQLIAGPIVHHKDVLPQFINESPRHISYDDISKGMIIFIVGLSKKVILADYLATITNPVFNIANEVTSLSILDAWGGALAYTCQLYFDFSGYSDMAIGVALLFGITLPLNFNAPYKATSLIDFWRRWHITLSSFLRDYLYIPLGGNRKGELKRYRNLFITMILGGIWHGAGWTFIIWGGIHGCGLSINHLWLSFKKKYGLFLNPNLFTRILFRSITFTSVVIAWVFFRAESTNSALKILNSMFTTTGFETASMHLFDQTKAFTLIALSLIVVWTCPTIYEYLNKKKPQELTEASPYMYRMIHLIGIAALLIVSILLFLTNREPEFLYYDF